MKENWGNNKNQMVNQKKFECELQLRPRVEVANNQKKREGLTMLIVESREPERKKSITEHYSYIR